MTLRTSLVLGFVALFAPLALSAQELRIVESTPFVIDDPEAYRAYYNVLDGAPAVYSIESSDAFRLSLVVLAPDVDGARTDFRAEIVNTAGTGTPPTVVDGATAEWIPFFDTSGRDDYLAGPIFQVGMDAGTYEIRITNVDNAGAYVLLLGEERGFSIGEIMNRYSALPTIKSEFFGKPSYQAFLAPLLLWPIIAVLIVLALVVFLVYLLQQRRSRSSNLG